MVLVFTAFFTFNLEHLFATFAFTSFPSASTATFFLSLNTAYENKEIQTAAGEGGEQKENPESCPDSRKGGRVSQKRGKDRAPR